jgi:O-antigen/teichoic acid export membrane protein
MTASEDHIERDRYSLNVVAEYFSRALALIGGLVSTVILYRSIAAGSWTADDYGAIKVLSSIHQVLLPVILLGLSGAVVRVAAEYTSDRERLGETVTASLAVITFMYLATATISIVFDFDVFLLGSETGVIDLDSLRLYWFVVLLTMLPSAYLRIVKSIFSGIQQMKRTVVLDIAYNLVRTLTLVYFFYEKLVTIYTILVLNLVLGLIVASMALGMLVRELKRNNIPWTVRPGRDVMQRLTRIASVFLIGSMVTANFNSVTVLWVNVAGTLTDVGLFSIAQGITLTVRMILGAPLVALGPNLSMEYARGRMEQVERKFRESSRMIVPTNAFSFAALFAFATPILRVIYGADGVAATGFLQLLSFNIIIVVIPGVYTYVYLAADDMKGLLASSLIQIVMPTLWIIIFAPVIGVNAIALAWVSYIPIFFAFHWYSVSKYNIGMDIRHLVSTLSLAFSFAVGMYWMVNWLDGVVRLLPVIGIMQAGLVGLFVIPLWYLFIAVATFLRLVDLTDLENVESVLRIVPPTWWVSKPVILRLKKMAEDRRYPA